MNRDRGWLGYAYMNLRFTRIVYRKLCVTLEKVCRLGKWRTTLTLVRDMLCEGPSESA